MTILQIIAAVVAVAFVILVVKWLTEPSCWMCEWCGHLYLRDGSPAQPEDQYAVSHGLCPKCAAAHQHSFSALTTGRSEDQLSPRDCTRHV